MKIAVITDAHANLPALEAVLDAIRAEGCDMICHLGDAIAIGPFPRECVDLLLNTPNLVCTLGNHELYYLNGLPQPQPVWMSEGEINHQRWTHEQLGPERRYHISKWKMSFEKEFVGVKTAFLHYGLTPAGTDFFGPVRNPTENDLDRVFDGLEAGLIFFGHDHSPSDLSGQARYINPGSVGTGREPMARYSIATYGAGQVAIEHCQVPYEDQFLFDAFENRDVPEREFIYKAFFGGRVGKESSD